MYFSECYFDKQRELTIRFTEYNKFHGTKTIFSKVLKCWMSHGISDRQYLVHKNVQTRWNWRPTWDAPQTRRDTVAGASQLLYHVQHLSEYSTKQVSRLYYAITTKSGNLLHLSRTTRLTLKVWCGRVQTSCIPRSLWTPCYTFTSIKRSIPRKKLMIKTSVIKKAGRAYQLEWSHK